jgi:hypothetical protein
MPDPPATRLLKSRSANPAAKNREVVALDPIIEGDDVQIAVDVPIGETLEEEAVENVLMPDTSGQQIDPAVIDAEERMSIDDRETRDNLRRSHRNTAGSDSDVSRDDDNIKHLVPARAPIVEPKRKGKGKGKAKTLEPKGSMKGRRLLRGVSESSQEEFPSPGTRAREVRDRAEKAQKAAEYVAPKGTRAAAMRS